jgi:hypothetical protein
MKQNFQLNKKLLTGMIVKIHYKKKKQEFFSYEGAKGTLLIIARGKGPKNCLIDINGKNVVVPYGNII